MTALVPTKGHEALVRFAVEFCDDVTLIISSRSFEPVSSDSRIKPFKSVFPSIKVIHHCDDHAPQNPSTKEEWNYWKNVVGSCDYIIGSENYCSKIAELVGAQYIPFDPSRAIFNIKGTSVRNRLPNMEDVMPSFATYIQKKIVLFGQESTGKSTMARYLSFLYEGIFIPEWARTYLESLEDKTITEEKMDNIAISQYALQQTAYTRTDRMFFFHDTDLLSTIGYSRIYNKKLMDWEILYRRADLYIVMNDEIPFVKDPLRYGGEVRESTKQFWIDLLEEFGCNYYVVKGVTEAEQHLEIAKLLIPLYQNIRDFQR